MIYVMELDVTFSTGLHELPALVGNEGARETAMIEIKRKYISALLTKCEVKIAGYWSVKNSMAASVLKNTSDPNNIFGRPYEADSQRKLFEIQRQTLFTNTRNSYGNKMAVAFAVIFMAHIEKQLLTSYKPHKLFLCERYIDDIFCVWTIPETESNNFIDFADPFYATFRFTREMSSEKIIFLDTEVFTGQIFTDRKILDV